MARRRFFIDEVRNGRAVIEGENAHHLTRVLRVEPGQKYEITDTHRVWLAEVVTARKSVVEFEVVSELEPAAELPEATLYLALIKFERFEWAVEKATELAVTRIVPVEASRSERGLAEGARKRVERWRRIAREAGEQSRRLRPPEVEDPIRFEQMLATDCAHRFWLDERPGAKALRPQSPVALAIGPEGGWADHERAGFGKAHWTAASLGPAVLRAETAATAALAVWLNASAPESSGASSEISEDAANADPR